MKSLPMIGALLLLVLAAEVQAADVDRSPPPSGDTGVWDHSRETAKEWWQGSREAAGNAWNGTQERLEELWRRTQAATGGALDSTRELFDTQQTNHFDQIWDQVLPKLDKTLRLEERQDELPRSAWLGDDQASNQAAIDALLDEAVSILSTSDLQQYRERIRVLQTRITEARQNIAKARQQRVSAPESSMVKPTVKDLDRAIKAYQADIAGYEKELSQVRRAFSKDLRGMGLNLTDEQVELLLSTVVGDNLIDLGIVFDNVKAITAQLERLVQESGEDLQSARRYYGMYVVLLKSLDQMHRQVEQAITERYIPQIDAIMNRAKELTKETLALQERSPDKTELLAANLSAQQLTIQAAAVYRKYLVDQAKQVADARAALEQDIATAWNTYETVRVSGELVVLVRSSGKLLDGLLDRQVPTLRPFQNLEMKREFEKLTIQLRRGKES